MRRAAAGSGRRFRVPGSIVLRRWLSGSAIAAAGVVLCAPFASAHVSVTPASVQPGSTTELTFRVPNEEAGAATTRLTVQIPTEHPIAQLLARPVAGWTVSVRTTRLDKPLVTDDGTFHSVVSQVTWAGGRILPGQYQDFSLSADPMPDVPTTLVFKALQAYSNGDVVRWIDVPQPGEPEPEHPAPVLTVAKASTSSGSMDAMTQNGSTSGSGGSAGKGVAWVALVVAVVAAVLAGSSFVRSRRST
jgi:periplasmic copper chaperone A